MNDERTPLSRRFRRDSRSEPSAISFPENVSFHFRFAPHMTKAHFGDFQAQRTQIEQADFYVVEVMDWDKKFHKDWQKIADGDARAYERELDDLNSAVYPFKEFARTQLAAIFGTKTRILMVDLEEKREDELQREIQDNFIKLSESSAQSTFDKSVDSFIDGAREQARIQLRREQVILDNLSQTLARAYKKDPNLRLKSEVKILLHYGSAHVTMAEEIRKAHSDRVFVDTQDFPGTHFRAQLIARVHAGEFEPPIEDKMLDLAKKAYIETSLHNTSISRNLNVDDERMFAFISGLSDQDMENLYKALKRPNPLDNHVYQRFLKECTSSRHSKPKSSGHK